MATIDCTLDGFLIPALPSYQNEFGTKKASGGLSTAECVDVTAMPFSRQRPFAVTETSTTSTIEAHSSFRITEAGITLALADAAFAGCEATVTNASGGAVTVKAESGINGGSASVELAAGACLCLVWNEGWRTKAAFDGEGGLEFFGKAVIDGVEVPASDHDKLVNGVWHAYTVAGLLAWREAAESDLTLSCVLHNSLDLTGVEWTPLGTEDAPYTGCFDGAGHSLNGLVISSELDYVGFFGCIGEGGECKGLHLGPTCSVTATGSGTYSCAGGIAGYNYYGTISNCTNSGTATVSASGSYHYAGGIAGHCYYGSISNCTNSGTATVSASGTQNHAGGIAGNLSYGSISNCSNSGQATSSGSGTYHFAGGIAGQCYHGTISNCANHGTATGGLAGGIAGYSCVGAISNCSNSGTATCNASSFSQGVRGYAGGCVGADLGSIIACCSNRGTAKGISGGRTGGVVGSAWGNSIITCCSNRGTASTGSYVGAIAGACYSNSTSQYSAVSTYGSPTTAVGTTSTY